MSSHDNSYIIGRIKVCIVDRIRYKSTEYGAEREAN